MKYVLFFAFKLFYLFIEYLIKIFFANIIFNILCKTLLSINFLFISDFICLKEHDENQDWRSFIDGTYKIYAITCALSY